MGYMRIPKCFGLLFYTIIWFAMAPQKTPAAKCPCDIYAEGGTPCVAAHSTVRALYSTYNGPLYQVQRKSDSKLLDIPLLSQGGYVNAAVQDSFLKGTSGIVYKIYDQSDKKNDLPISPKVLHLANGGTPVIATDGQTTVNGYKVYGIKVYPDASGPGMTSGGNTYRNNQAKGLATGDQAEGMYAVCDAKYYNGRCCFDYGNVETDGNDDGNATMETIEYGNMTTWSYGTGSGPWILVDLENGVFAGDRTSGLVSANTPLVASAFVTLMVKGNSGNHMTLKGGDAQTGVLATKFDGNRPAGYNPQHKQGAVELGTGGDGSSGGDGIFYEGAITFGLPPDSVDNQIQANVVAAGYGSKVTRTVFGAGKASPASGFTAEGNMSGSGMFLRYALPKAGRVCVNVFDEQGRTVAKLVDKVISFGNHETFWDTGNVKAGIYLWKITLDGRDEGAGRVIVER
jgi:hypothetical protein